MLKDLPHESTDSLGKHSCRNVSSLQKEAYPAHDEKEVMINVFRGPMFIPKTIIKEKVL